MTFSWNFSAIRQQLTKAVWYRNQAVFLTLRFFKIKKESKTADNFFIEMNGLVLSVNLQYLISYNYFS